jgi:hypothetical protein
MSENTASTEQKSWYDTGYTGIKREQDRIDNTNTPNRVWIPAGGKRELVFVDDEPVGIHEHNPKINGDWKNWFTCGKEVYSDSACCELLNGSGYKPYYIGFYTVIDCSEWVDKKGNKYQYELKLFPAKLKTLKRLEMRRKDRGPFAGKLFSIMRIDGKSAATGDEFEMVRDVDMAKLFTLANYKGKKLTDLFAKGIDEDNINRLKNTWKVEVVDGKVVPKVVPFNYSKILYPLSPKDIRSALSGQQIDKRDDDFGGGGGSSSESTGSGGGSADETVPF